MWGFLWLIMVIAIISVWKAPDYWGRKVHPLIIVETEAVDDIVDIGDPVTFRCRFINPTRLPCPRVKLSWRLPEQLRSGSEQDPEHVKIDIHLMPRQVADVTFTVYAARRGVADWKEAHLEFTDALGLRKDYRTVYVKAQALIRPNRKKPIEMPMKFTELLGEIRTRRFYNEDPSLFTGIRPYQTGDPLRGISWFASAKSGELMVKQFGHTTASKVLILFNGQMFDQYWQIAIKNRIDLMCQKLVQISEMLIDHRTSVGLLTNLYDGIALTFFEPPADGAYQLERLANRMGSVSPHPMSSMADLIHSASKYANQGDTILLITSYWNEEGIRALYELNRKYKSVVVYSLTWDEPAVNLRGIPTIVEHVSEEDTAEKGEAS